jgi:hypothetical protein
MPKKTVELVRRGVNDVNAFWEMLDEYVVWDMRSRGVPLDLDPV